MDFNCSKQFSTKLKENYQFNINFLIMIMIFLYSSKNTYDCF